MNKLELVTKINELKESIRTFEIDRDKHEEGYKEVIDESGPVMICGLRFVASRILEEVDPIAYRCGLNDWVDSLEVSDDEEYKELETELEDLEAELEKFTAIEESWEACDLMKLFEIAVYDKRLAQDDCLTFDIEIKGGKFHATHESLNAVQEASKFISFVEIEIDADFSLDENLQSLYEACTEAIEQSEYFAMRWEE